MYKILFISLVFFLACEGSSNDKNSKAKDFIEKGRKSLNLKEYEEARAHFNDAVGQGKTKYEAQAYLGLSFAEIKSYEHDAAYQHLKDGLRLGDSDLEQDFNALLCFAEYRNEHYLSSIVNGLYVLEEATTFTFTFDETIDQNDIHITLAQSYYMIKDYTKSLEQIKLINTAFDLEETILDFELKLLAEIERLNSTFHSKQ